METIETTRYGVLLPDGSYDWTVTNSYGSLDTPKAREEYRKQFKLRLKMLGVPTSGDIQFVTQKQILTCEDPQLLVDEDPESVEPDDITNSEVVIEESDDSA